MFWKNRKPLSLSIIQYWLPPAALPFYYDLTMLEVTRSAHGVLNISSLKGISVQLLLLYLYITLWVKSAFGCVHGLHWPSICESIIWLTLSREDVVLAFIFFIFFIWKLGWERLQRNMSSVVETFFWSLLWYKCKLLQYLLAQFLGWVGTEWKCC